MDIVGPFVGLIDNYLIAPLSQQINYLRRSSANVNDMQTAVRKLMARRDDNQSTLKISGDVETKEASNWFKDVEAIKNEADAIEVEYNKESCCVNCYSRYRSSKRSIDLKQTAEGCLNQQFVLARQPSLEPVREIESEPIENQPSTLGMLEKILGCIGDPKFEIIGVYGMGGVGKTTLAKQVNNHFSNNTCFETVIMVTVSATPNIPRIRTTIGKRLGFDLSNTTDEDDAREKLYDALKRKKFLLILDDVWSKLKLKDVGIPRNHKMSSKILLTSRSQDACTDMGAKITMKVEPLSSEESWSLFVEKVGQHVTTDDRIKQSAQKIVGKCKGLPLAIVTVARAMANRHGVEVWEDAARGMEQSAIDLRGMRDDVFVPLKFSFDRLDDNMLRSLFLYCACFPQAYNIGRHLIINYCVGEGFADRFGSLRDAGNKGVALIETLKIACMLEDGEDEWYVRMHDMVRDLALWIASSSSKSNDSPNFLIRTGKSYKKAPNAREWVDPVSISLINTEIKELPELEERCENLTTLLLRKNMMIRSIPPTNFLQHMDHLSVLDLTDSIELECLPDSLSSLVNLRVLRLENCKNLRTLPTLGMLRKLQVLDLFSCLMLEQILGSDYMEGLSNLRYLNVSNTKVCIPGEVISSLAKLEELKLYGVDNIRWRVSADEENEKWDGRVPDDEGNIILNREFIDVGVLSQLTLLGYLDITFQDIIISEYWYKPLANKILYLELKRCTIIKQDIIQALNESEQLRWLVFENCPGLTCLPTYLGENLKISECGELEKLLDGAEAYQDSFQRLHCLELIQLPKLERICVGLAPINCFAQLITIMISQCRRLKMVFTKGMPRLFNNLKRIEVSECDSLEVIIEVEEEKYGELLMEGRNSNKRVISPFPNLEDLQLKSLPELTDVCNNLILHCPLLKNVIVDNCPRLKKDPLHIRNTDGLLVMKRINWDGEVSEEEIQEI